MVQNKMYLSISEHKKLMSENFQNKSIKINWNNEPVTWSIRLSKYLLYISFYKKNKNILVKSIMELCQSINNIRKNNI